MNKTTLRLIGAVSTLAVMPGLAAEALPMENAAIPKAQSFAELLAPISDASARLKAADSQERGRVTQVDDGYYHHHHHHHHHHHYHHHHHHHHHHGIIVVPGLNLNIR